SSRPADETAPGYVPVACGLPKHLFRISRDSDRSFVEADDRFWCLALCTQRLGFVEPLRPDVETTSADAEDFPHSPDATAFIPALVGDFVLAQIALRPPALSIRGLIPSAKDEWPNPVATRPGHYPVGKRQCQLCPRLDTELDEISDPRTGWKSVVHFQCRFRFFRKGHASPPGTRLPVAFIVAAKETAGGERHGRRSAEVKSGWDDSNCVGCHRAVLNSNFSIRLEWRVSG